MPLPTSVTIDRRIVWARIVALLQAGLDDADPAFDIGASGEPLPQTAARFVRLVSLQFLPTPRSGAANEPDLREFVVALTVGVAMDAGGSGGGGADAAEIHRATSLVAAALEHQDAADDPPTPATTHLVRLFGADTTDDGEPDPLQRFRTAGVRLSGTVTRTTGNTMS